MPKFGLRHFLEGNHQALLARGELGFGSPQCIYRLCPSGKLAVESTLQILNLRATSIEC